MSRQVPLGARMIALQHVSFRYDTTTVFKDYSAQIPDTALCIGPNGCGKTTLLKLIAGVSPLDSGQILLGDSPHYTATTFFHTQTLFDAFTVEQHLTWVKRHASLSQPDIHTHIENFNLTPLLHRRPSTLSLGQRQWLCLALTCLMPADLILLDEPFQHLDTPKITHFCHLLHQMANRGARILLTAHAPIDTLHLPVWEFPQS